MRMEPAMLDSGYRISSTGKGDRHGLMEKSIKDSIELDANMEKGYFVLLIKVIMTASSAPIKSTEKV